MWVRACVRACVSLSRGVADWQGVGLSVEGTGIQNHMLPFRNLGNFARDTLYVPLARDVKSR